jgi:ubiquinone biosynthesis protein Coq4
MNSCVTTFKAFHFPRLTSEVNVVSNNVSYKVSHYKDTHDTIFTILKFEINKGGVKKNTLS